MLWLGDINYSFNLWSEDVASSNYHETGSRRLLSGSMWDSRGFVDI